MLRIAPTFEVLRPETLDEVVNLLDQHGEAARLIAGGTDFVPNLKHGLYAPEVVIDLKGVSALRGIEHRPESLVFGALVGLHEMETDTRVQAALPSLSRAASLVAGPQQRRMGTLGGNLCLDTRCVYINQTEFWRGALGGCLKKDGDVCHVTATGKKCVAAASNDTAPVLISLGATVELLSPRGVRLLPVDELYINDGIRNLALGHDEVLTRVFVPRPGPQRRMGFEKLRTRGAIDFSLLNCALAFDLDDAENLSEPVLIFSAVAARPRSISQLPVGRLDAALIAEFGRRAFASVRPLTNINADVDWRREMVPHLVSRAFEAALGRASATPFSLSNAR